MITMHLMLWVVVLYIWARIFQNAMAGFGWIITSSVILAFAVMQIAWLLVQLTND